MKKLVIIVDSIPDSVSQLKISCAVNSLRVMLKAPKAKVDVLRVNGEVNLKI